MKKIVSVWIALSLVVFAGCSSNVPSSSAPPPASSAPASSAPAASTPAVGQDGLKTGLAVISNVADSTDADEKEGLAKTDSTIVAVTVDGDGRIVKCVIDGVQTSINFSKEGKILTDKSLTPPTKNELGAEYGMAKASGIGKEWNEQAAAFADYVTGKTVDEIKGIAMNDKGAPADADLAASVTIRIGVFIGAIEKAVSYAQETGAQSGDRLGLGTITNIAKSTDAGAEEGLAQAYSTYTAVTVDAAGKISSCYIDGSQCNVNFDTTGKITSDIKAQQKTKNELGDAYGMRKASSIGKEWNEQAAAYARYVTGKTVDEIKGIAVNEKGAPTDADLAASVTIGIQGFNQVIEKAVATAK